MASVRLPFGNAPVPPGARSRRTPLRGPARPGAARGVPEGKTNAAMPSRAGPGTLALPLATAGNAPGRATPDRAYSG